MNDFTLFMRCKHRVLWLTVAIQVLFMGSDLHHSFGHMHMWYKVQRCKCLHCNNICVLSVTVAMVTRCYGNTFVMAICPIFVHVLQVLKAPVQLQYAFALNRRNYPGDRDRALTILEKVEVPLSLPLCLFVSFSFSHSLSLPSPLSVSRSHFLIFFSTLTQVMPSNQRLNPLPTHTANTETLSNH